MHPTPTAMLYSEFKTLKEVSQRFGLTLFNQSRLFKPQREVEPSEQLTATLDKEFDIALAIDTEKARSEMIIAPVLKDVRERFEGKISYFSGSTFNVDPAKGLGGEVDFLLSASPIQLEITAPVLTLVEGKNADTKVKLSQCAAQMVGARKFNQSQGIEQIIWGASTTGVRWRFMRLEGNHLQIDLTEY